MEKYFVTLTSPSHHMMNEPYNYVKAYEVQAKNVDEAATFVDEKLMRDFALEFKVALSSVRILFASKIKS